MLGCVLALALMAAIIIPLASATDETRPYTFLDPFGEILPIPNQPLAGRLTGGVAGKNILVLGYTTSGGTAANNNAGGVRDALALLLREDDATATVSSALGAIAEAGPATDALYATWSSFDAVIIAVVDDNVGALWASYHAKEIEARGTPVVVVVNTPFSVALQNGARKNGFSEMRYVELDEVWLARAYTLAAGATRTSFIRDNVLTGSGSRYNTGNTAYVEAVAELTRAISGTEVNPETITTLSSLTAEELAFSVTGNPKDLFALASQEFFERSMQHGFGDGFPLYIPTPELVNGLLAATERDPEEVIGRMLGGGLITVRKVAVNAAMTGVRPAYFSIVLAAMEAYATDFEAQRAFDYVWRHSDDQLGLLMLISGPIAREIGIVSDRFEWGVGVFGGVFEPNVAIGRAVKLCFRNIGHNRPEDTAMRGGTKRFNDHAMHVTAELLYETPEHWTTKTHSNAMGFTQQGANTNTVSLVTVNQTRVLTNVGGALADWNAATNFTTLRTAAAATSADTQRVSIVIMGTDQANVWGGYNPWTEQGRPLTTPPEGHHQSPHGYSLRQREDFQRWLSTAATGTNYSARNRNLVWPMYAGGSPGMSRVFNAGTDAAPFSVKSYVTQYVATTTSILPPSVPRNFSVDATGTLTWEQPERAGVNVSFEVSSDGGRTWITAPLNTRHTYNLPAGTYQFAVRAVDSAVRNTAEIGLVGEAFEVVTPASGRGAWAIVSREVTS